LEDFSASDLTLAAGSRRISAIDALRALAMTAVVAEHSRLLSFGWSGVWLFYVISGFVVTGTLVKSRAAEDALVCLRNFYTRRAVRIIPIYLIIVAIGYIVATHHDGQPHLAALSSLLFFYNNFALAAGFGNFPGFDVGNLWTISVEMQFYAIYGLLFIFCDRRIVVGCLIALIFWCPCARWFYGDYLAHHNVAPLDAAFSIYSSSFLQFDAFAAGCLLALFKDRLSPTISYWIVITGLGAMVAYCIYYIYINSTLGAHGVNMFRDVISGILFGEHREAFVYIPFVLLSAGVISLIITKPANFRTRAINALAAVGTVSYGGYVYHITVLGLIGRLGNQLHVSSGPAVFAVRGGVFVLTMILTLAVAFVSYRFFEQPLISRVGRALRNKRAVLANV
jgi:peptidoglycan/LPS O-acetylase OafA/YrhL